jgi:hypothetical protein
MLDRSIARMIKLAAEFTTPPNGRAARQNLAAVSAYYPAGTTRLPRDG